MIYGAMLAGGVGSRMKSATIPKQFLEVNGQPIILYTLRNMLKVSRFDYIYIATHHDYIQYMKDMVEKYVDTPDKVRIIEGGKERMDSIHNVTDAIVADEGLHDDDVIVIHDAVRPLVTEKILNEIVLKNIAPYRVLLAINKVDQALDGDNWNKRLQRPNELLSHYLDELSWQVENRINESTGINVIRPVCYSAKKGYNIRKLKDYILENVPKQKRIMF